jgi:hypothetical protein
MKRFMLTVALTCALSVSALAGEIPTVVSVTSNTPPPPVSAATAPGEESTVPTANVPAEESPGILEMLTLAIITWPWP